MIVLITGVSTGLGKAFAEALFQAGHTVIGTVRKEDDVSGFEELAPGRAFARLLDVTDAQNIVETVTNIEASIGPIYALINNAGYGHEGTLEESPIEELRQQFEVNVFGAVAMIKAVLPFMRQRRSGRIINITSMGGLMATPGLSFYHGSKFALEGISSSLGKEVEALRHPRHGSRARYVPYRLGGKIHAALEKANRGLRRDLRSYSRGACWSKRQAAR